MEVIDVGCNLKQFDGLTRLILHDPRILRREAAAIPTTAIPTFLNGQCNGLGLGLVLVAPFHKHFVGIAAVGIAACTLLRQIYASGSALYGLEACPLKAADLKSLDYIVVGAFMKIFKTKSKEVATYCMEMSTAHCRPSLLMTENINFW